MYESPADINMSNIGNIFTYMNNVTLGWASRSLLIGLFLILAISYYKTKNDILESLAVSSFIVFIISIFFWVINFADPLTVAFSLGLAVITMGILFLTK